MSLRTTDDANDRLLLIYTARVIERAQLTVDAVGYGIRLGFGSGWKAKEGRGKAEILHRLPP